MRYKGSFKGKDVVVFGLGTSGWAAAQVLIGLGARVSVVDEAESGPLKERAESLRQMGAKCYLGMAPAEVMRSAEMVVVSPGVPTAIEPLELARRAGASVMGELELSFMLCDADFLAITGTKGKSTTTRLLHRMLSVAGFDVVAGGNLPDEPLCAKVMNLSPEARVVAEVSSFQLETIITFRPRIACITNLDVDHLDRYPGLEEYYAAKRRIFENQQAGDLLVLNAGDAGLVELARGVAPRVLWFGMGNPGEREGVFLAADGIICVRDGERFPVLKREDIALPGLHNVENVMAAAAMAIAQDVPTETIREALAGFKLAPHTLEVFAMFEGITFVDDSHATNTLAVTKALEAFEGPIILIAGGRDKGCDWADILETARGKVKTVIAIGEARPRIAAALGKQLPVLLNGGGIPDVVAQAASLATRGDVVLLSPGCSSFDMFKDFRDRGNKFKKAVLDHLEGRGHGVNQAK